MMYTMADMEICDVDALKFSRKWRN